ncbi:MAG: DUF4399 domain-containing protein [Deltaproteobacteria bacterium]|nr:DUF4399 domain-containing protein [Deltaproteobacteria bacterium]
MMRLILISLFFLTACPDSCNKKPEQEVFFENLSNNQKVPSTFLIKFGVRGLEVKPAGQDIENQNAGHHHILIDNAAGEIPKGQIIPTTDKSIHFGQGQTEAILELSPGKRTLTMQFGDGAHRSYGKRLASTVTVYVGPKQNQ